MRSKRTLRIVLIAACAGAVAIVAVALATRPASHPRVQSTLTARRKGRSHPNVPAKDRFSGPITIGTGRFKGKHGKVTLYLKLPQNHKTTRRLTLFVFGARCGRARRCVRLAGILKGTLTTIRSRMPDQGQSFTVKVKGRLKPVGPVNVSGTGNGPGFIPQGREELQLILKTRHGKIMIGAQSPPVRGFTSP